MGTGHWQRASRRVGSGAPDPAGGAGGFPGASPLEGARGGRGRSGARGAATELSRDAPAAPCLVEGEGM